MLDILDAKELSEADWHEVASRTELPFSWGEYAAATSAQPWPDSTRQYCRVPLRSIAIIWDDETPHAAYTKDISKVGVGFYAPVNLLPRAFVRLWVPGHSMLRVRVSRCRRLAARCFECGGLFEAVAQKSRG